MFHPKQQRQTSRLKKEPFSVKLILFGGQAVLNGQTPNFRAFLQKFVDRGSRLQRRWTNGGCPKLHKTYRILPGLLIINLTLLKVVPQDFFSTRLFRLYRYVKMGLVECQKCHQVIMDKYLISLKNEKTGMEYFAHENCVGCKSCGDGAELNCIKKLWSTKGDNMYCYQDFATLFASIKQTCHICHVDFKLDEMAFSLGENVSVHENCFNCTECKKPLNNDSQLSVNPETKMPYCYEHRFYGPKVDDDAKAEAAEEAASTPKEDENEENSDNDDESKENKKRTPRTKFTEAQTNLLMSVFQMSPRPTRVQREEMAKKTNLPIRCIQIWFQNRRSKEKRQNSKRYMASNPALPWYPYQNYAAAPQMVVPQMITAPPMVATQVMPTSAPVTTLTALPQNSPNTALYPSPPPSLSPGVSEHNFEAGLSFQSQPPSFETALQQQQQSFPSPTWSNAENVEIPSSYITFEL